VPFRALLALGAYLTAAAAGLAAPAADGRLRIPEVRTALSGRDLKVEARLSRALPEDVTKRLVSGLPTTATWEVRLFVVRRNWWDGLVDERRYAVTATYRPVGGDYTLERRLDGRLLETTVVPDREEALRALATLPGLPCFRMAPRLAGRTLGVRVRCVYGSEMALGLFPARVGTSWRRSPRFSWTEPGGAP